MSKAPPPSPIPTGKGSRSAATEIFTDYLENSLQVPDLTLPEAYIPPRTSNHVPDVSYRLLESGDNNTQNQVLKSAREFGVFRMVDHGISAEELQFLVGEADQVFGDGFRRNSGDQGNDQTKEETVWVRSGKERMELANKQDEAERFQDFSAKTENVASKLDAIAQQLCRVFVEKTGRRQYQRTIQGKEIEPILSLYRYNHKYDINLANEEEIKSSDHTLCLLLPTFRSHFVVQSDQGDPLSINAGSDTIVVTNGKYVKEWSMEDFTSVSGQEISEPDEPHQFSFLIQLKCLSFNSSNKRDYCNMISIRDQLLIVIGVVFLYNIYAFIWS